MKIPHAHLFLFLALLFIRLPFFFRDYMDRDESTFILMGQSIAEGYLPYDHLWDLKPPLLFYIFGLIESIFPHSLVAIRIFGTLIIFCSGLLLIAIARIKDVKNGLLIAFSYIILSSMFGSVQGVMSEHIAVFFMLAAVLFFIKKKTAVNLFLSGLLFGAAALCKMNYAYAVPAVLLYYFIMNYRSSGSITVFKNCVWIAAGVLILLLLAALPFIFNQKLGLFINSVFLAPFEYGQASQVTAGQKLAKTWWVIVMGLVISFFAWKKMKDQHKELTWVSVLILFTTIYTFFSSGTVNGHYLIQLYPFIAILMLGIIVSKEFRPRLIFLTVFVLLISIETWIEYYRLGNHAAKHGSLYNGKSFDTIRELKKRGLDDKKIFFGDYHIGYWFLDRYPLTKSTTHPSTLARPFFFKYFDNPRKTSMEELQYLFEEIRPEIIVSRNRHLSFFERESEENLYFENLKTSRYQMIYENTVSRIYIWQMR